MSPNGWGGAKGERERERISSRLHVGRQSRDPKIAT